MWLTTKQAQGCDDHASACFSCCYKNPDPVHGECTLDVLRPDGSCPINRCCDENDIVVECGECACQALASIPGQFFFANRMPSQKILVCPAHLFSSLAL